MRAIARGFFSLQVFGHLGCHTDPLKGLLFEEASHGSPQRLIDERNESIFPVVRKNCVRQAAGSLAYGHSRGIIYSDLRPDNFRVHGTWPHDMNLWLCDFGGSTCKELDLSVNKLPDAGFFDPNALWVPSPSMDMFSLDSVLYTILIGHWPFRDPGGPFLALEAIEEYENLVDDHFARGNYPEELWGGEIVLGCWTYKFSTMDGIVRKLSSLQYDESQPLPRLFDPICVIHDQQVE